MSKNELVVAPISKDEARAFVHSIIERIGDVRDMLIELHDRRGWEVLGHKSWDECTKKEFGWSKQHANMEIAAGRLQKALPPPTGQRVESIDSTRPHIPKPPIPTEHIKPLMALPENRRATVYQVAKKKHGAKITAKKVADVVNGLAAATRETTNDDTAAELTKAITTGKTTVRHLAQMFDALGLTHVPFEFHDKAADPPTYRDVGQSLKDKLTEIQQRKG